MAKRGQRRDTAEPVRPPGLRRVIGLTGGIASGKSTVSRLLRQRGVAVVDADQVTHRLQEVGRPGWAALRQLCGWPALRSDGSLDRVRVGRWVFGDTACREAVNRVLHPLVRRAMWDDALQAQAEGAPWVVLDVPLLVENGLWTQVDEVWVVWSTLEQQVDRLMRRNGLSRADAEARLRSQMPLEDKVRLAHVVLDNSGPVSALTDQVDRQLARLGLPS
jgi:dephospho-CoA kinase